MHAAVCVLSWLQVHVADHRTSAMRRVARAQQELDGKQIQDPHSEEAHRILRSIYFPGWKHRPHLTQVVIPASLQSPALCPAASTTWVG